MVTISSGLHLDELERAVKIFDLDLLLQVGSKFQFGSWCSESLLFDPVFEIPSDNLFQPIVAPALSADELQISVLCRGRRADTKRMCDRIYVLDFSSDHNLLLLEKILSDSVPEGLVHATEKKEPPRRSSRNAVAQSRN